MMNQTILIGDCRTILSTLDAESVHSCVTDPPYDLTANKRGGSGVKSVNLDSPYGRSRIGTGNGAGGFMGMPWDGTGVAFDPSTWAAVYRVLKPGAYLLAFGGTRTVHRIAVAIEDAGFEIRDQICWLYGSGFPKSLDVSKAIDKAAGAERETMGVLRGAGANPNGYKTDGKHHSGGELRTEYAITAPATDLARQWDGWGTALKPAYESIVWAQKPYDLRHYCGIMAPTIKELLCQFRSHAKDADAISQSSQSGLDEAFDSVLWNAVAQSSTPGDLYGLTDTLRSEWEKVSTSSIVWSWLSILGAVWRRANTFTTETASGLITDLKTLNSLLSTITPESIDHDAILRNGGESSALLADSIFSGVHAKLLYTLAVSAADPATSMDGEKDLRPNGEFIIVARKPFKGTVAQNVTTYGTGAINVDGCRIGTTDDLSGGSYGGVFSGSRNPDGSLPKAIGSGDKGRWPANVCLDEDAAADMGDVSRYFYVAKASRAERNAGLDGLPEREQGQRYGTVQDARPHTADDYEYPRRAMQNHHPTVKPVSLMQWLVRMVTPPGGIVLDPFMGSGTTGVAASSQSFNFIGIELNREYAEIARRRISSAAPLFGSVEVRE